MIRDISVDRADYTDVVDALPNVGKKFTHLNAAFTVLLKRKRGLHQSSGLPFVLRRLTRQRLAMIFFQHGFGIEAIDLRKPAIHKEKNDVLCFWLELGVLNHPRTGRRILRCLRQSLSDETGKTQHPEPAAHRTQRLTPGNWPWTRSMNHEVLPQNPKSSLQYLP